MCVVEGGQHLCLRQAILMNTQKHQRHLKYIANAESLESLNANLPDHQNSENDKRDA